MKLHPCERIINTTIPARVTGGYAVLDIANCLSQQNRRNYRQGMEYAVDNIEIFGTDAAQEGQVRVYKFPNTWVVANSWVKAFKHWNDQGMDAARESGMQSTVARYRDFKIYYNQAHYDGETAGAVPVNELQPLGYLDVAGAQAIDPLAQMEWDYSIITVPNVGGNTGQAQDCPLGMLGDNGGVFRSLIHNYALSRSRPHPEDPSTVTTNAVGYSQGGLYAHMEDVGEDMVEILDNLTEHNNSPGYIIGGTDSQEEFYPCGQNNGSDQGHQMDNLIVRLGPTIATDSTGPTTVLCGLLWFNQTTDYAIDVRVKVSAGGYQGVAARPMQDVN